MLIFLTIFFVLTQIWVHQIIIYWIEILLIRLWYMVPIMASDLLPRDGCKSPYISWTQSISWALFLFRSVSSLCEILLVHSSMTLKENTCAPQQTKCWRKSLRKKEEGNWVSRVNFFHQPVTDVLCIFWSCCLIAFGYQDTSYSPQQTETFVLRTTIRVGIVNNWSSYYTVKWETLTSSQHPEAQRC